MQEQANQIALLVLNSVSSKSMLSSSRYLRTHTTRSFVSRIYFINTYTYIFIYTLERVKGAVVVLIKNRVHIREIHEIRINVICTVQHRNTIMVVF